MKRVIFIDEPKQDEKPIEFTHYLDAQNGWVPYTGSICNFDRAVYLGKCDSDGDMFSCYKDGIIYILKGHLNSGNY